MALSNCLTSAVTSGGEKNIEDIEEKYIEEKYQGVCAITHNYVNKPFVMS